MSIRSVQAEQARSISQRFDQPEELGADVVPVALAEQLFQWRQGVIAVLESVGLRLPAAKSVEGMGGRIGRHSDDLGTLLDEMTSVWRSDPLAKW